MYSKSSLAVVFKSGRKHSGFADVLCIIVKGRAKSNVSEFEKNKND